MEQTYALSDVIHAAARDRQKQMGFVSLNEASAFDYPTFFTCIFDHAAFGEGSTAGVVMGRASSAEELRRMAIDHFGEHYANVAELWPRFHLPVSIQNLIPEAVRTICDEPSLVIGDFYYCSTFHLNHS